MLRSQSGLTWAPCHPSVSLKQEVGILYVVVKIVHGFFLSHRLLLLLEYNQERGTDMHPYVFF